LFVFVLALNPTEIIHQLPSDIEKQSTLNQPELKYPSAISQKTTELSHTSISTASIPDVAFAPYIAKIQEMIKLQWRPLKEAESTSILVHFAINEDGSLSDLKLIRSNASNSSNEAALNAVKNAAPFPPLPAGSAPSIDIEFTFDYNLVRGSL
jgi:TonB family protein